MIFAEFYRYCFSYTVYIVYYSLFSYAEISSGEKLHKLSYNEEFWRKIYWTTTREPDFWWKKYTKSPFEEEDRRFEENILDVRLIVFTVILIVIFIVIVCGAFGCICISQNTGTRQAPNRLNIPYATQNGVISPSGPEIHINTSLSSPENPSNLNVATDTPPPTYDIVVLSDLSAQTPYFPEVKPSAHESPPPKYEEYFVKKY